MSSKTKITIGFLIGALIIACVAAYTGWHREIPVLSRTEYLTVPELKPAANIPRVRVPVKAVVTLAKKAAAEKLQIPEPLAKDDNQQVIATATLPPYEGHTSTITMIDTSTGESRIIARQEPLSFFALENKKEVGLRYGLTSAINSEADLYGRWEFLRIGSTHLGVYGELTSLGEYRAMISITYRW